MENQVNAHGPRLLDGVKWNLKSCTYCTLLHSNWMSHFMPWQAKSLSPYPMKFDPTQDNMWACSIFRQSWRQSDRGIGKHREIFVKIETRVSPNICDSRCFLKCFPVCQPVETLLRKQNLLPEAEKQKCFLANSETFDVFLCFSLMFLTDVCPLWETWRNIGRKQCFHNNVS
jgi:hypothetical protein